MKEGLPMKFSLLQCRKIVIFTVNIINLRQPFVFRLLSSSPSLVLRRDFQLGVSIVTALRGD